MFSDNNQKTPTNNGQEFDTLCRDTVIHSIMPSVELEYRRLVINGFGCLEAKDELVRRQAKHQVVVQLRRLSTVCCVGLDGGSA